MSPTAQQVKVATDTLRTEAGVWDQESGELQKIVDKLPDMHYNRTEAGIFQMMVSPMDDLVNTVSDRCKEGVQRFHDVGTGLRTAATTYDAEEANNTHQFKNLW
ncbi:hypothetical protein ACFXG4_39600 [Nocardia sp. NPDC059246]|uniref:hypothetical protein n=1 Tax=unclassified Nocardia TaxID=2637762 RepID=UPI0036C2906C